MKKHIISFRGNSIRRISFILVGCLVCFSSYAVTLVEKLQVLSEVSSIQSLKSNQHLEKLVCFVDQQLDWHNLQAGTFKQRVVLTHRGFDKPTVMVTEGYGAGSYVMSPNFREELSELLDANLVFVEHRYFLESTPSPCNWDYLTVANSAGDYHHIRQLLADIYPGKWFTTGISKGGQTTLFYRTYYPNDVDGSVAYVAPLNKSLEDGRHQPFLRNIKNKKACKAVHDFQLEVLKRRASIQPLFEAYCKKKGYTFRVSMNEIFDLSVLEYEFAFWQWGNDYKAIPSAEASDQILCDFLLKACEPDYFSDQSPYTPFNVQAMREIGYYGYDVKPFAGLLSIDHSEGYMRRVMIPDSLSYIEFDTNLYEKVNKFLDEEDLPMIFIYGENDPWTSTGVTWLKGKKNMHVFVDPEGSHLARVGTMPANVQIQIKKILADWLQ